MKKVKILEMADTEVSYCGGAETLTTRPKRLKENGYDTART